MKLADVEVSKILDTSQKLTELMDKARGQPLAVNPVYLGTPENDFLKSINAPWIRVTNIPGDEADYADDQRLIEYPKVQVDFWINKYKLQLAADIDQLIYQLMRDSGYERYYENHYVDVDISDLLMFTANFQYLGL